jgi:hypothetical protein
MKKINENEAGSPEGFASLDNTPGMGDVVMPTQTRTGSGDLFGSVMDFSSWKRGKKRRSKRKRRTS